MTRRGAIPHLINEIPDCDDIDQEATWLIPMIQGVEGQGATPIADIVVPLHLPYAVLFYLQIIPLPGGVARSAGVATIKKGCPFGGQPFGFIP